MAEYIEREAAKEAFGRQDTSLGKTISAVLDSIPAADVAPMSHGKWTDGNPICPVCGMDKFDNLDADIWSDWKPKYCPNCGSKMDME